MRMEEERMTRPTKARPRKIHFMLGLIGTGGINRIRDKMIESHYVLT